MLPAASAATPSAALVLVAFSLGSGMKGITPPPPPPHPRPRNKIFFFLFDVDPARPAELTPLLEEPPVAVENLDPVVAPIGDEQPSLRVEREAVRLIELPRTGALPAELAKVLSVFVHQP